MLILLLSNYIHVGDVVDLSQNEHGNQKYFPLYDVRFDFNRILRSSYWRIFSNFKTRSYLFFIFKLSSKLSSRSTDIKKGRNQRGVVTYFAPYSVSNSAYDKNLIEFI